MPARLTALQNWLSQLFKTNKYKLVAISEDASFRSYFRLYIEERTFVVMDAPLEHEDCKPFIAVTQLLKQSGINVPEIHALNLSDGFMLLTDFGDDLYLHNLTPHTVDQLYADAIKALVKLQTVTPLASLSNYSETLLRHEMSLFNHWLIGKHLKITLSLAQQAAIEAVFDVLVANAVAQPQVCVHRDFHSRNLMVTEKNNPGIIDYQDAVIGPLSYDLVSLLKDCYIKWPMAQINGYLSIYSAELNQVNPTLAIKPDQFKYWFDLMGVQRHLKASGIFARLSHRDGKHHFLQDIPRTLSYIVELNDSYPMLQPLNQVITDLILPTFEVT